jgi:hypothetical protein
LPICVDVKYIDGNFDYKITYAFIKIYPKKQKAKKVKKHKKSSKDKKSTPSGNTKYKDKPKDTPPKNDTKKDTTKDTSKEKTKKTSEVNKDLNALETLNMVLDIFKAIKNTLGEFITSIRVTNLYINFQVADLDAYDCALKFGKLNIILGNVLGFLQRHFKVKKKSINVVPKYNSNDSLYDISFKVKLGLGKGLGKILVMLFKVIPILKDNDII